jgi:hypothetical protein
MKTIVPQSVHSPTAPLRRIRRFNFAVAIIAFCLFPNAQGLASGVSPRRTAAAQDTTGKDAELGNSSSDPGGGR